MGNAYENRFKIISWTIKNRPLELSWQSLVPVKSYRGQVKILPWTCLGLTWSCLCRFLGLSLAISGPL